MPIIIRMLEHVRLQSDGAMDPKFDRIENYHGFGYCWRDGQECVGSKDVLQEIR